MKKIINLAKRLFKPLRKRVLIVTTHTPQNFKIGMKYQFKQGDSWHIVTDVISVCKTRSGQGDFIPCWEVWGIKIKDDEIYK